MCGPVRPSPTQDAFQQHPAKAASLPFRIDRQLGQFNTALVERHDRNRGDERSIADRDEHGATGIDVPRRSGRQIELVARFPDVVVDEPAPVQPGECLAILVAICAYCPPSRPSGANLTAPATALRDPQWWPG